MINSMTGFGASEREVACFGKISVELRSSNHKFLEAVLHLPPGFLSLEDKMKKEIEAKIKRGRVVCAVNISGDKSKNVFVNRGLLKNYAASLRKIKAQLRIKDNISLDALINLPGVLCLAESNIPKEKIWVPLKSLLLSALVGLVRARRKEGQALAGFLKAKAGVLEGSLKMIKLRFKKVICQKAAKLNTGEERSAFLKNTDITEEVERLAFHIRNFLRTLAKNSPVGKELDFIAQEMQREANTIGAKSCDALISARVVQLKSQVEKIREQTQNIE